ncbi:MAG: leucyl/phenylalanyl-tRNA--protein transferase [Maricaulis sp.]|jgi:leucyl/phenylalanyl-tRNA--protein transferase|nr:leucyl/phenylalanyl-tRNA--protein transferase [Maricaulis sp.]
MMRGFGADELLDCYARGVFPMAEGRDDPRIFLLEPDERGILPLTDVHIPRSLKKSVRQDIYDVTVNLRFEDVVAQCATSAPGREETWINDDIRRLYTDLHHLGHAHSIECWRDDKLVGGLYGVTLGAAFFGESMFSTARDASKVALIHLVARLQAGRYKLLDTQFMTEHLTQFGGQTIAREKYRSRLETAKIQDADFMALPLDLNGAQTLQSITQKS